MFELVLLSRHTRKEWGIFKMCIWYRLLCLGPYLCFIYFECRIIFFFVTFIMCFIFKNPEFNQDSLANSFLNPKICALYSNSENPEIENNTRHNLIWLFIFYIAEMLYMDLKCILK